MRLNKIIQWWFTPSLPKQYIEIPSGCGIKIYILKWLIHPIKRRIAKGYLILLRKCFGLKVIGITGSAGKTTTKEMIASILRFQGPTVNTFANIDPIYNIPSTILRARPWTKYLVLEMGVEYPGEMDYYLWLAKPDIGLITNIFPTHTEFLGSVEGVFKEKSKLVLNLDKNSFAVLNKEDFRLRKLAQSLKAKVVWFGSKDDPLKQNSQAAEALARCLNISSAIIVKGIRDYEKPEHRLNIIHHNSGAVILDDSYNSNPRAALTTIDVFNKLVGKNQKIAILGDMLELGTYEEEGHRLVGKKLSESNFNYIVGVGRAVKFLISEVNKGSPKTKTVLFPTINNVLKEIQQFLRPGMSILIKGSRSIGLDKLVDDIMVNTRI